MKLRPTSDRLRGTLFNILGATVEDSLFVDVFAGSGAIGIEALSRGDAPGCFYRATRASRQINSRQFEFAGRQDGRGNPRDRCNPGAGTIGFTTRSCRFHFFDPPYAQTTDYLQVLRLRGRARTCLRPRGICNRRTTPARKCPSCQCALHRLQCCVQSSRETPALSFYRLATAQKRSPGQYTQLHSTETNLAMSRSVLYRCGEPRRAFSRRLTNTCSARSFSKSSCVRSGFRALKAHVRPSLFCSVGASQCTGISRQTLNQMRYQILIVFRNYFHADALYKFERGLHRRQIRKIGRLLCHTRRAPAAGFSLSKGSE